MSLSSSPLAYRGGIRHRIAMTLRRDWQLWVLLLPCLVFFIVFCYFPMYGIQIAFKDYKAVLKIEGSPWVGLKHFEKFFGSYYCGRMFLNTFLLNFYGLLFGFPVPIILAILLNQLNSKRFKGFAQTAVYVPHFISTVVLAGMIYLFFSPTNGIINHLITAAGGKSIYFIMEPGWFRPLFIGSDIWQNAGWNTILYIATLTGIAPQLYEAASLLQSNTDKALLLQTSGNMATSDIFGVYVYNVGIAAPKAQYSYASAIGLCLNIINFVIIMGVNAVSRKMSDISLF